MLNIAICDDHNDICSQVEGYIQKICRDLGIKHNADVYYSGKSLCKKLESGEFYDLIFLDVELADSSGVDVGEIIRNEHKNDVTQIAYISSKTQYAMALFKIQPINFLIKPLKQADIENVINKAIKLKGIDSDYFTYKYEQKSYNVKISDIMYFIKDKRKIYIKTRDGGEGHQFYGKLEDIYAEQLKKYNFLHIHKSYMVNYKYVKSFGYESLTMSDGKFLPISRSKVKEVREFQLNFESGGDDNG